MDASAVPRPVEAAGEGGAATIGACRACGGERLEPILSLGDLPIADRLLVAERLDEPDELAPLTLMLCRGCALVQLETTLPRAQLFDEEYPYLSSTSPALLAHAAGSARELIRSRGLGGEDFVLELGSNDGYMLRNFVEAGVRTLGIDPSGVPARAARGKGVPTLIEFFTAELAERLAREHGRADLVIANNVLAHVGDLNDAVAGIASILAPDGLATLEFPYVLDLVDGNEFDTIYHQHLCYFSLTAAAALFESHGLAIREVRRLEIHGGSLQIRAGHGSGGGESVRNLLAAEQARGVSEPSAYTRLGETARGVREALPRMIAELREGGARIAAYGAAAKGTTLLGYCGLGRDQIDFVVDRNRFKQGRYLPGCRLEIRGPDALLRERPDYALLLSWNFADEILAQQAAYRRAGGHFIVPIPSPRVV